MLDMLKTYLQDNADALLTASILRALELFDEYELEDYESGYLDIMMTLDNSGLSDGIVSITDLTRTLQDLILSQMGIELSEDTKIRQANTVLEVMRNLEATDMCSDIVVICTESSEPAETLCEIIHSVSGLPAEEFYDVVFNVSDALIDRIREICEKQSSDHRSAIDREQSRKAIERLKRFKLFIGEDVDLAIWTCIMEFTPLLQEFSLYYDKIIDKVKEDKSIKGKAIHLFGATIVSSDAVSSPKEYIQEELNKTFTSIDEITPIMVAVQQVILDFESWESSGVKLVEHV